ncbi:NAD(P)/FAD-dependent oxidoreductase [Candidatus Micrarchaeota archaeon]|nr:NAD(P)/FAD-dependent oxidoreductase [Candidatus Micrarchaeota archaeon]
MTKLTSGIPPADKRFDAIVVGAGPSGCSCALFLARSGRKVLLLDKATFPREKVCGDAFSGKSIGIARELGVLGDIPRLPHGIVRGLMMVAPSGKKVDVPFPNASGMEFAGYTVERQKVDNLFFQLAQGQKNITILQGFSVTSLERSPSGAVCGVSGALSIGGNRKGMRFFSKVVVGADGAASIVGRQVVPESQPKEHIYSAVRGYWSGISGLSGSIELYFIDGVLPGYLWIFPMAEGKANVGLGILSSDLKGKHPTTILQEAISNHPSIAPRFANAKLEGKVGGWAIPNGSYRKPNTGDGWLLVGDAASLVDPFSGEGVGNALSSGKYAALAIDSALENHKGDDALPASALGSYEEKVARFLRKDMANSYRLQRLSRHKFLLNLFIGKAADKPEVRQMLVDMLGSDKEKEKVVSPAFYLKLLLP